MTSNRFPAFLDRNRAGAGGRLRIRSGMPDNRGTGGAAVAHPGTGLILISRSLSLLADFLSGRGTSREPERRPDESLSSAQTDLLFEANTAGMLIADRGGRILRANRALHIMLGYPPGTLEGLDIEVIVMPEERGAHRAMRTTMGGKLRDRRMAAQRDVRALKSDGTPLAVEVTLSDLPGPRGGVIAATIQDISARREAERKTSLFSKIYAEMPDALVILDPDHRILDANPAFFAETGFQRQDVIGAPVSKFEPRDIWSIHAAEIGSASGWSGEAEGLRADGSVFPQLVHASTLRDTNGAVLHHVRISTDISAIKKSQQDLEWRAHHDPLTGLANRSLFEKHLAGAVGETCKTGGRLALAILDLDHFKDINDVHGHAVGDAALQHVAARLSQAVDTHGSVARLGGDEFIFFFRGDLSEPAIDRMSRHVIEAVNTPMLRQDMSLSVGVSLGIALYPDDATNVRELFAEADRTLYEAKRLGRNRHVLRRNLHTGGTAGGRS